MKLRTLLAPIALATLACTLSPASAQFGGEESNLIKNGNFELMDPDGRPEYWAISHPNHLAKTETEIAVLVEGGKSFYRVTKNAATGPGLGWQKVQIPTGTQHLRIAVKMRGQSIVRGSEGWNLPGIGVTYFYSDDENDNKTGDVAKWPLIASGDSEWREYETVIPVRDGAPIASIGIIGAGWTGTADFTDIVVEPID